MGKEDYDVNSPFDQNLIDNLNTRRYTDNTLGSIKRILDSNNEKAIKAFEEQSFDKTTNQLKGKSREYTTNFLTGLENQIKNDANTVSGKDLLEANKQNYTNLVKEATNGTSGISQNSFLDKAKSKIGDIATGKTIWGDKAAEIAPWANAISGGVQGIRTIGNISKNMETGNNINDLKSQIVKSFNSNPLAVSSLTADQLSKVQALNRGSSRNNPTIDDVLGNIGTNILPIAGQTLLGLATGNPLGAVINAVGGTVNAGIEGYNKGQQRQAQELESLYSTLAQADQEYNANKRQRILRNMNYY
jgi:hypothetical protein